MTGPFLLPPWRRRLRGWGRGCSAAPLRAQAGPSPPAWPRTCRPPTAQAGRRAGAPLCGHLLPVHLISHELTGEARRGLSPGGPPLQTAIPGKGVSTASTWPPGSQRLLRLASPGPGGRRCWSNLVLLQTWPLSGVAPFYSGCESCEAGASCSSPAQPLVGATVAPPPPPLVYKRSPHSDFGKVDF